jgi:hypothetical protein
MSLFFLQLALEYQAEHHYQERELFLPPEFYQKLDESKRKACIAQQITLTGGISVQTVWQLPFDKGGQILDWLEALTVTRSLSQKSLLGRVHQFVSSSLRS